MLEGRRIVDVHSFIAQIQKIDDHLPFHCSFKDMTVIKECRKGLNSCITLKCKMCNIEKSLWTNVSNEKTMDVNTSAVSGTMSTGGGHSQLEEVLSCLYIPCMSYNTFRKYHDRVADAWKETAERSMEMAAEEKKHEAIKRGDVDADGVPLLMVVADGCWAKRSYRTNYNSLSGVAAIVGYHTKKVLYVGVKNKYCTICVRAERLGKQAREHTCFKNWGTQQSSTSMEAALIAEGFSSSEKMYGVRYNRLIADGDSSVYKTLLDRRPYKNTSVLKIECRNHLMRNYCNKIREIAQTSNRGRNPIMLRKKIGDRLVRLRYAVTKAVIHKENVDKLKSVEMLKEDILNGPNHVFGDHSKCKDYF
ncbi:uncharacterized protein LOC111043599 isoform X2 [Nilaparvata lugens]|nr:uncharacterized protein LOC111043599 isoform X2 [Nilaparvata lugens]